MDNTRKICTGCGAEKDIDDFAFKNIKKNIRKSKCRVCTSEYGIDHYNKNKADYIARVRKNNIRYGQESVEYVINYLLTHPCIDCGEDDIIILEFDHKDGKNKKQTVSYLIRGNYPISTIKKEIEKCDVRCANCHRRKTINERGDSYKYLYLQKILLPVRDSNS